MDDTPITVFLADDHDILREGLRVLLDARDEFEVVGEAADGREAVQRVRVLKPDIVIMDIAMPELNGIEATRLLHEDCLDTRVLILSMYGTRAHVFRALQAGAHGYLVKRSAGPELIEALQAVRRGERFLSRHVTDIVVDGYLVAGAGVPEEDPLLALSSREREVLQLLAEGCDNKTIAAKLHLSPKTVHTYRSRMLLKLGLHDTTALIRFAVQHGVTPEA